MAPVVLAASILLAWIANPAGWIFRDYLDVLTGGPVTRLFTGWTFHVVRPGTPEPPPPPRPTPDSLGALFWIDERGGLPVPAAYLRSAAGREPVILVRLAADEAKAGRLRDAIRIISALERQVAEDPRRVLPLEPPPLGIAQYLPQRHLTRQDFLAGVRSVARIAGDAAAKRDLAEAELEPLREFGRTLRDANRSVRSVDYGEDVLRLTDPTVIAAKREKSGNSEVSSGFVPPVVFGSSRQTPDDDGDVASRLSSLYRVSAWGGATIVGIFATAWLGLVGRMARRPTDESHSHGRAFGPVLALAVWWMCHVAEARMPAWWTLLPLVALLLSGWEFGFRWLTLAGIFVTVLLAEPLNTAVDRSGQLQWPLFPTLALFIGAGFLGDMVRRRFPSSASRLVFWIGLPLIAYTVSQNLAIFILLQEWFWIAFGVTGLIVSSCLWATEEGKASDLWYISAALGVIFLAITFWYRHEALSIYAETLSIWYSDAAQSEGRTGRTGK